MFAIEAQADDGLFSSGMDRDDTAELRLQAVAEVEESLRLDPTGRESYRRLVDFYTDWDQPREAAAAARRLLERSPDDADALQFLASFYDDQKKYDEALACLDRLRKLQPLDEELKRKESNVRMALARQFASAGRYEEGRAQLDLAAAILGPLDRYALLARRAALEFKAGQTQRAEDLLHEAYVGLRPPTAFWLLMAIEVARYKLTPAVVARFAGLLEEGLAQKVSAGTAADMATTMAAYLHRDVSYPGRDGHVRSVVAYLKRTSRIKYSEQELLAVCQFLKAASHEQALYTKMVSRGVRRFPVSAPFLFLAASLEFDKGPFRCNIPRTRKQLEKALSLAEAGAVRDQELIDRIKEMLLTIKSHQERLPLPFFEGRRGMPDLPPELMDLFDDVFGVAPRHGDEDEDEEDGDDMPGPEAPSFFSRVFGRRSGRQAPHTR